MHPVMGSLLDILLAVIAGRDCIYLYYRLNDLSENVYSTVSKSTTLAPIIHPVK
jgi:hypothetical protein